MIELELTYLAGALPSGLKDGTSKKIVDMYIESGTGHNDLRVRRNGSKYEITRKRPIDGDVSKQTEETIELNDVEFQSLTSAHVNVVEKTRYFFEHEGRTAEFDVFEGGLAGLVLVDFEFETEEEKDAFVMPDFCLVDITQEKFIAGGILAGKKYADIEADLNRFEYRKL